MKKYIFTIFAVAAVLSSCSKSLELNEDNNSGANAITTIEASSEITTRAAVSSSDNTKVNWESGDQLGVWGTNSPSEDNLEFTLVGDGGSTTGTFKNGSSSITTISAVMYPYQASASWDGTDSKLTCEIPSVQTAKEGSFDKSAAIMYSIGNTTNVKLKFAVNFLKVTIGTGDTNIHSITISSDSTALSGKIDITSSSVAAVSGQSLKSVTLTAGKNKTFESGVYYIAVKADTIVTPTISIIRYEDGYKAKEYSKTGSGNLEFASGKNVKPISVDFSTITTATGREAVQLWADGPYWATMNVGATTVAGNYTTCYGDLYEWGSVETIYTGFPWTSATDGTFNFISGKTDGYSWTTYCGQDPFQEWKPAPYNTTTKILNSEKDAATQNWGTGWRMPTSAEFYALYVECGKTDTSCKPTSDSTTTTTTTTIAQGIYWCTNYNGIAGLLFITKGNGPHLFFPAAGRGSAKGFSNSAGSNCYYWSSSLDPSDSSKAYRLDFTNKKVTPKKDFSRYYGFSVRPVSD